MLWAWLSQAWRGWRSGVHIVRDYSCVTPQCLGGGATGSHTCGDALITLTGAESVNTYESSPAPATSP